MSQTKAQLLDGKVATIEFTGGSASTPSITFTGDVNTGLYSPGADQVAISTNGTGRLFVTSAGDVCLGSQVGPNNDGSGLSIYNTSFPRISFRNSTTGNTVADGTQLYLVDGDFYVTNNEAAALIFRTNSTERMRLDSSGRLGIGTSSPGYPLELTRPSGTSPTLALTQTGWRTWGIRMGAAPADPALIFFDESAGAERARIDSSGRLLIGPSTSRQVNASINALQLQIEGTTYQSSSMSLVTNQNVADGSYIVLGKSRGTSLNSSTIVNSGDSLGAFWFCGADGNTMPRSAVIEAFVDGTPGASDMPGRLVFSTTADGASSPTERMRIASTGNVLINRTSDNAGKFAVNADTTTTTGNRVALFASVVGGDSSYECIGLVKTANDTTTANVFQVFYVNAGTPCGRINANGAGSAAFGSTSDVRLKKNIIDLEPQLEKILSLRPVEFDYIESEGGGRQIGFIAQEVETVYPDTISARADGMKMLTGWSKTEARLVKALQEAMERIEALEAKVAALGGA